jgi:predicted phage baseplate assembly protein
VTATYRVGTGLAGQVAAEQLSILLSRPLGLTGARNPLPAVGAADPEPRDEARRNAPVAVRTLDRVVSLVDVADLARTFGGIAKAAAAWLWVGDERVIHVTVVPADGSVLGSDDPLLTKVADAVDAARHPGAPVVVAPHHAVPVALQAGIVVHPDFVAATVLDAARSALTAAFALAVRDLAQPLAASEILAVLHRVDGLVAVDVDLLYPVGEAPSKYGLIGSSPATVTLDVVSPAELVWLDPAAIDLFEVTP